MSKLKKSLLIFGIIWFALVFYFIGYLIGHKNLVFEKNYQPKIINRELKKPQTVDFGIFWKAYDAISEKYVGQYSVTSLVNGAIKGMVESLGDPYSTFLTKEENNALKQDLSGEFEGIGAELSRKDNRIVIIAPLEGSPAKKAGLKPQDQIIAIGDQDTTDMPLEEAVSQIRGKAGTSVKLLINRNGWSNPREITIVREKITIVSVTWEMKENSIGYIKVSQFGDDTTDLVKKAAKELDQQYPRAIVLDLRNNPGGYLDVAVDVTSLFVPQGSVVVKEQYKDGHKEELRTTLDPILSRYKVIVLVNEGSASASEITAGALQDLRGATLVGQKTFGKGVVQEIQNLDTASALKLTVAKWLTPNDRTIDKEGIKPDIEIANPEDSQSEQDPQLERALEEAGK